MGEHHPLGPSHYPAWQVCPCWEGSNGSSSEAKAGTSAHKEVELGLSNPDYTPDNFAARWAVNLLRERMEKDGIIILPEKKLVGTVVPLDEIFGTTDATWEDNEKRRHYADFKTFSDGTVDFSAQLMGYAALDATPRSNACDKVVLHILHGGICQEEIIESTVGECFKTVEEIIKTARDGKGKPCLCKWCQYCSKIGGCVEANNAVQVVQENGLTFSQLSICQKLVVLDAVDKLSATIRQQAKDMAGESEDKAIEMDGIRYELKPWAGKSVCRDICEVAGAVTGNAQKSIEVFDKKKGETKVVPFKCITQEQLLALCDLPKSKLADALKVANAENKELKKVDIENYVKGFYEATEGTPHFIRTK